MSKYSTVIGPGTTIGAMAVGPGAKVEGSVTVGSPKRQTNERLRMKLRIRGAISRDQLTGWLTRVLQNVKDGANIGAIGNVDEECVGGCAWEIRPESAKSDT